MGHTFEIRADGDLKSKIYMSKKKVNWGNKKPGDTLGDVFRKPCNQNIPGCLESSDKYVQDTKIFVKKNKAPAKGTLTFRQDSEFKPSKGDDFVDALVAIANKVAKGKKKSWAEPDTSGPCLQRSVCNPKTGKDKFWTGPAQITIERYSGGKSNFDDMMEFTVQMDLEEAKDFSWCGLASSIAGIFTAGTLSGLFGAASLTGC